ncbi:MAG: hypothetical protein ACLFVJ_22180, partial [Persicimonas sp.]
EYSIAQLAYDEFTLGEHYGVELPSELILLSKALVTVEGAAMNLVPDVDLAAEMQPHLGQLQKELFSISHLREQVARSAPVWWDVLDRLPLAVGEFVERQMVSTSADSPDPPAPADNGNQLISGLAPAALIVGGSYLLGQSAAPLLLSISVPGALLVLTGLLLWGWVVLRSRAGTAASRRI